MSGSHRSLPGRDNADIAWSFYALINIAQPNSQTKKCHRETAMGKGTKIKIG
jgi:hypothetical protein